MTGDDALELTNEMRRISDAIDRLTEVVGIQARSTMEPSRPVDDTERLDTILWELKQRKKQQR